MKRFLFGILFLAVPVKNETPNAVRIICGDTILVVTSGGDYITVQQAKELALCLPQKFTACTIETVHLVEHGKK